MSLPSRYQVYHTSVHYSDLIESKWFVPGLMVPALAYPSCLYPKGQVGRVNIKFVEELGACLASCNALSIGVAQETLFEYDTSLWSKKLKIRIDWPGYRTETYEVQKPYSKNLAHLVRIFVTRYFEEQSRTHSSSEEDASWWLERYSPEDIIVLAVEHVEDLDCKDGKEPDTVLQPILAVRTPTAR
ncbi:hypothetical protein BC835DRAFT_677054 [Cytidiella melzeri]|nr:hypothetical protein BC835DRAFT_308424 [Cytidiella melzeri]KAI0698243.1 hypothetical protein BC835DRAFT_677054 [Cytidiella melzeri]